jgi:hypothetical protein
VKQGATTEHWFDFYLEARSDDADHPARCLNSNSSSNIPVPKDARTLMGDNRRFLLDCLTIGSCPWFDYFPRLLDEFRTLLETARQQGDQFSGPPRLHCRRTHDTLIGVTDRPRFPQKVDQILRQPLTWSSLGKLSRGPLVRARTMEATPRSAKHDRGP